MILISLVMVAVSFVISFPLAGLMLTASRRLGLVDSAGIEAHKRRTLPVPNTGGVAIFAGLAIPMTACLLGVWLIKDEWWARNLPDVYEHLDGLRSSTSMGGGILTAVCVMHVMGLIDDRRALGPWVKLVVQLLVSTGLATVCGVRALELLDAYGPMGYALSVTLSVVWITVIINAMNFLDNMDGLSGGVGVIIAGIYLAATLIGGQWFVAALSALLLGALLGFLVFNFPPAKLYMGDAGSLVVGTVLAVVSLRTTYFDPDSAVPTLGNWYGVLMPLMVMAVPLYDLSSVIMIRLARGESPLKGDKNHYSHRLVRRGLSTRRAVLAVWACTLACGLSGVMLGSLAQWQAVLAACQAAAVVLLLATMDSRGSRRRRLPN
jgi:UDP-GlcNAc:undecaprenyl-phosphate/decaprenyl-phosphate GlcNAc-1-phosphate transferase